MGQYGACGMAAAGAGAAQILTHYYRGTAVTRAVEVTDLRVLVGVSGSFTLTSGGTTTLSGIGAFGAGGTVTVRRSGNSIVASGAVSGSVADALVVHSGGAALRVSPPGNRFNRGTLVFRLDAGGGLRAIVQGLSTNAYLRGLGEMSPSWPLEALKAQAIAARTGALKAATRAGRWSSDHDLDARRDGAYIGHDMEFGPSGSRWVAAVDGTAGVVVTHDGALINALYASSTGGHTEHSENVWVSPLPYLRGVPDPHDSGCGNPLHSWQASFTGTQLGQKLGMGPVTAISFGSGAGVSGRVDKVPITFTDSRGARRSLTGAQVKAALGLRSTLFGIDGAANNPAAGGTQATGSLTDLRVHDRRNLLVAGAVRDPDGPPKVYVATRHDGRTTARVVQSVNGSFLDVWPVEPGTHVSCVAVLDHPTGASYLLGCRENVVK